MERIHTLVASGGHAKRQALLHALEKAGCDISEQWELNPSHFLERGNHGWITVYTDDIPMVLEILGKHKWTSKAQWLTPKCPQCRNGCEHCNGTGHSSDHRPPPVANVFAEMAKLRAEVAELKAGQ